MFDDWNQIECPLNFSVILWKSWTSWRTRVNSSEPFQWCSMTCKYCQFPTCFCSETDAVRGLGRKTVVGSDRFGYHVIMMWFHSNNSGDHWKKMRTSESHICLMFSLVFYLFQQCFLFWLPLPLPTSKVSEVMAGVKLDGCCMIAPFEVFLRFARRT